MNDAPAEQRKETRDRFRRFVAISTRWADNDVYGHVNNVTQNLVERGALDVTRSSEIGVVVETMCRFFKPVAFPDALEVGLRVARLGRSSIRYEIGIFRHGDHEAAAAGHFVHVYVRRSDFQVVPVPDPVRRAVEELVV
jgi:acyl-CoA thioester hydrolase